MDTVGDKLAWLFVFLGILLIVGGFGYYIFVEGEGRGPISHTLNARKVAHIMIISGAGIGIIGPCVVWVIQKRRKR